MNICSYYEMSLKELLCEISHKKTCLLGTMNMSYNQIEMVPMWFVSEQHGCELFFYLVVVTNGEMMNNMMDIGVVSLHFSNTEMRKCCEEYTSILVNGIASAVDDCDKQKCIINNFIRKYGTIPYGCDCNNLKFIEVTSTQITGRVYTNM